MDQVPLLDDVFQRRVYHLVDEMFPAWRVEDEKITHLAHLQ